MTNDKYPKIRISKAARELIEKASKESGRSMVKQVDWMLSIPNGSDPNNPHYDNIPLETVGIELEKRQQ